MLVPEKNSTIWSGLSKAVPIGVVEGRELSINLAFPSQLSATPRPVVLLIHGGGFVSGSKDDKNRQILKLSELGFVAASVSYALAPDYRFPTALEDIKLAIRFVKANARAFHIDSDRILVSGSSAGGYLAVMAGVTGNDDNFSDYGLYAEFDSTVRAVAAQSAPIGDFRLEKYGNRPSIERLLGSDPPNIKESIPEVSPFSYLDSEDPAFFLSHGDSDIVVPVEMSREFVEALKNLGHSYEYHEVEGGGHSLNRTAPDEARRVFEAYLNFLHAFAQ